MTAILLVPSPEWRDRLLAAGLGDSHPPMVGRSSGASGWSLVTVYYERGMWDEFALVLAWDGQPIDIGCDRLARALGRRLCSRWTIGRAGYLAEHAAPQGMGDVVILEDKP